MGDAVDHRFRAPHFELAGGEIVEEVERFGGARDDVIDAHRHQVDANGIIARHHRRQFELGADAIGRRHQHRVAEAIKRQFIQRAESAEAAEHAGAVGTGGNPLNPLRQLVAGHRC